MDNQSAAQFRLEPSCLRRHDFSAVGDVHNLLHRYGIECQGSTHLTGVDTALQLAEAAQTAYEVDALRRTQVADVQDLVENQTAGDVHVEHTDGIIIVVGALLGLE